MRYVQLLGTLLLTSLILAINWYSLNNIDFFDYSLTELGLANWSLAPYVSRFALGILGVIPLLALIFYAKRKVFILVGIAFSLGMFLISLAEVWICGLDRPYLSLYELWPFSKWQGTIWLLYAGIACMLLLSKQAFRYSGILRLSILVFVAFILALPFILNYPSSWAIYGEQAERDVSKTLQLDSLYQLAEYKQLIAAEDEITQGPKLICFASLTCPYCSRLAYKLHILKERNPNAAILLVLTGDPKNIERFERKSNCRNVPRLYIKPENYTRRFGGNVPLVFQVNGKQTTRELEYWALNDSHLAAEKIP
jgi:hypothetical protein